MKLFKLLVGATFFLVGLSLNTWAGGKSKKPETSPQNMPILYRGEGRVERPSPTSTELSEDTKQDIRKIERTGEVLSRPLMPSKYTDEELLAELEDSSASSNCKESIRKLLSSTHRLQSKNDECNAVKTLAIQQKKDNSPKALHTFKKYKTCEPQIEKYEAMIRNNLALCKKLTQAPGCDVRIADCRLQVDNHDVPFSNGASVSDGDQKKITPHSSSDGLSDSPKSSAGSAR